METYKSNTFGQRKALKVLGMIDVLDDHDDVQEVFANFDLPEEIFNEMS